jgi:hypothetical protein
MMDPRAVFGLATALSLLGCLVLSKLYVGPRLRALSRTDALTALVAPHVLLRFIGLSFLVPGVVSPELPLAFAIPAAYGDMITGVLAIVATAGLSRRAPWAQPAVWGFNIIGFTDLVFAVVQGARAGLDPGRLGAAYFVVTAVVPPLLVSHVLTFGVLVYKERRELPREDHRIAAPGRESPQGASR